MCVATTTWGKVKKKGSLKKILCVSRGSYTVLCLLCVCWNTFHFVKVSTELRHWITCRKSQTWYDWPACDSLLVLQRLFFFQYVKITTRPMSLVRKMRPLAITMGHTETRKSPTGLLELFVVFSCSVMSDFLRPHGLQHARLPCPSLSPGAYSNSCLLSQWCHPTILPSVVPFSSCPQSFLASGSFSVRQPFASGSQYWSFSFSISPSNEYSWLSSFRIDWFDLLAVQWALKSLFQHHSSKASILQHSVLFMVQLSHIHK